jgi:hypothetical protein
MNYLVLLHIPAIILTIVYALAVKKYKNIKVLRNFHIFFPPIMFVVGGLLGLIYLEFIRPMIYFMIGIVFAVLMWILNSASIPEEEKVSFPRRVLSSAISLFLWPELIIILVLMFGTMNDQNP